MFHSSSEKYDRDISSYLEEIPFPSFYNNRDRLNYSSSDDEEYLNLSSNYEEDEDDDRNDESKVDYYVRRNLLIPESIVIENINIGNFWNKVTFYYPNIELTKEVVVATLKVEPNDLFTYCKSNNDKSFDINLLYSLCKDYGYRTDIFLFLMNLIEYCDIKGLDMPDDYLKNLKVTRHFSKKMTPSFVYRNTFDRKYLKYLFERQFFFALSVDIGICNLIRNIDLSNHHIILRELTLRASCNEDSVKKLITLLGKEQSSKLIKCFDKNDTHLYVKSFIYDVFPSLKND